MALIVTSEKTWQNIFRWKLAKNINDYSKEFDLAVTMNGYNVEGISKIEKFSPEYFFLRPNLGFDAASIAYSIGLLPLYDYTIILHDDHWFADENWFEKINKLVKSNSDVDVWGNILFGRKRDKFDEYCESLGFSEIGKIKEERFLHGMCGVFKKEVIKKLKEVKLPYKNSHEKEDANLGERFFSALLFANNFRVKEFPEGVYRFLLHNERNYTNHLISKANAYLFQGEYLEAKKYFYSYWDEIKKINFYDDVGLLFYNLSITHYELGEVEQAKLFFKKAEEIFRNENLILQLPVGMEDLFDR